MKREAIPELLDTDTGTPREIADSLADLRMINRWFGGIDLMAKLIRTVAQERQLKSVSWLDVAGSTGDVVRLTSKELGKSNLKLEPVLLDRASTHMKSEYPGVCGDALALPFRDKSFDVVGSALFIHHLEPHEIVQSVNEGLRVARHAVLINDLVRHPLHLALTYAGYALYRSRLTRHDAVASVRRAYTVEEMKDILRQTKAARVEVNTYFMFRMGVIAWNPQTTI
jgi:ubiquinone/menaquinone biosynthesis C-methylase UbiE